MTKYIGSNWSIILGLSFMAISLYLILTALNNTSHNKLLFNVSRLMALLSVAGIWYFGNILTKNTDLKISELTTETEKYKKEAEVAKLEREKLLEQQKYIKSISAKLSFTLPTNPIKTNYNSSTIKKLTGKEISGFLLSNGIGGPIFLMSEYNEHQIDSTRKLLTLYFPYPKAHNELIGKELSLIKTFTGLEIMAMSVLNKYNDVIPENGKIELIAEITINGIIAFQQKFIEESPGQFAKSNIIIQEIEELSNVPDVVLGNKKILNSALKLH